MVLFQISIGLLNAISRIPANFLGKCPSGLNTGSAGFLLIPPLNHALIEKERGLPFSFWTAPLE